MQRLERKADQLKESSYNVRGKHSKEFTYNGCGELNRLN